MTVGEQPVWFENGLIRAYDLLVLTTRRMSIHHFMQFMHANWEASGGMKDLSPRVKMPKDGTIYKLLARAHSVYMVRAGGMIYK